MKKITIIIYAILCALLAFLSSCTEKESQVEVSSVSLNTATIEMVEGETFNLVATVLPKDAEYDGITWASSNASVASVNSGTVTALKEGTATITASAGGKSSTCSVKVSAKVIPVTSVTLDKTSLSMQVGETETLTVTVSPADATDKNVTWSSSDVSVATVADGKIIAKKSGTATITAKSGNCTAECVVSVSVNTESLTLDKTTLSLAVGESAQLTATISPADATDKNVTWTSSDESVAKVADGKVTAVKAGIATITAKCGDKSAECAVTVTVPVASISLDKTTLSLAVGESAQLTATVNPVDATDKNVTWTSSDESVAKVADGKVTAVKSGKAVITAKCGGKSAECAVTVAVPTGSVTLDKTTLSLAVGESAQLTATVSPADATDRNVIWASSDESVAKVSGGKVTALKAGKATITAKCGDKTAECAVTVTVPVASVSLDKTTLSLAVGEPAQLTATVSPADATDRNVTWTSSDESVAKVNNGKVTAMKAGTVTITARCGDKFAMCTVMVIVPVTSVSLDKTNITLIEGETIIITATVEPNNATDKTVVWRSSDESVVKVENGKVYAVKTGVAQIEAIAAGFSAYCDVEVISSDNVIYYTSTNNKVVNPFNNNAFGANIVSNEYSDGRGRMVFDTQVTAVGAYAFYKDYNLETIKLPNTVSVIGENAFNSCFSLVTINIPDRVTFIGKSAFLACTKLTSIDLPPLITLIEDDTFHLCPLPTIVLPDNIIKIGESAFAGASFKTIDLPNGLQSIGKSAFSFNDKLTKVIIPDSVVSVGVSVFQNCEKLAYVEVGEGVTVLLDNCFKSCTSLSNVTLPSSITGIYSSVFDGCPMLDNLYLKAVLPPKLLENAFGTNTSVNIWVPKSSVEAYKAAEGWSKYKDNIKGYDF